MYSKFKFLSTTGSVTVFVLESQSPNFFQALKSIFMA